MNAIGIFDGFNFDGFNFDGFNFDGFNFDGFNFDGFYPSLTNIAPLGLLYWGVFLKKQKDFPNKSESLLHRN